MINCRFDACKTESYFCLEEVAKMSLSSNLWTSSIGRNCVTMSLMMNYDNNQRLCCIVDDIQLTCVNLNSIWFRLNAVVAAFTLRKKQIKPTMKLNWIQMAWQSSSASATAALLLSPNWILILIYVLFSMQQNGKFNCKFDLPLEKQRKTRIAIANCVHRAQNS